MFVHLLGRWIMVGRGLVLREENSRSWEAIRKGKVLMTLEMIRCDKGVSSLDKEIDIKEDKKKNWKLMYKLLWLKRWYKEGKTK